LRGAIGGKDSKAGAFEHPPSDISHNWLIIYDEEPARCLEV
jgi:hypothetical protein